jgi:hypothetical protein
VKRSPPKRGIAATWKGRDVSPATPKNLGQAAGNAWARARRREAIDAAVGGLEAQRWD